MPIDPYQQNYDVGNGARSRSALLDELRQKAVQAQTEQNTQFDTNRVDLMKSVLSNMVGLRDTFGSVDTGAMLGQFGIQTPQGLGAPDTFSALRDDTTIQGLKAGAMAKMAEPLKAGFLIGPDGQLQQVATPGERIANINNAGALQRTQLTQAGMDRRAASGGGNSKERYQKVAVEVRDPRTGAITTTERYVPIPVEGELPTTVENGAIIQDETLPITEQNLPPESEAEQAALQSFDELTAQRGFEKVTPGVKQADGSYLFDITRRGDQNGEVLTYRVAPDGSPPQRIK